MTTQREFVIFESALALDPLKQQAFLDEACGSDLELRRVVEDLLATDGLTRWGVRSRLRGVR